ncbi:phage virion morphogenesis protein [Rhodopila sp.]|uniref:phage virion morphogenesis protein n=1 Tax=Rhodopila sp. TaxID=2480087 RepID=UPI003D0E8B7E
MITVEVDDRTIMTRLQFMPDRLRDSLRKEITKLALTLVSRIQQDKLSGQVLNVRTGNLRRSITDEVTATATSVTGRVFSDKSVKYAAIHEFGGTIQRVGRIKGPYEIKMPQRAYMLPTFRDMQPEIEEGMKEAVKEGLLP